MQLLRSRVWLLTALYLFASLLAAGAPELRAQTVVTFPTEDGMTLYGTLHLPKAAGEPGPGVILFAEPQWIVRSTLEQYGRVLAEQHGLATLTVDFRGNGRSGNGKLFHTFSPEEADNLQLDVRGAVKFLSSQKQVDPKRIGIMGVGIGANYALLEAAKNPAIQALVLVSGSLSERARNIIKTREEIPILCLAGPDDKEGFREMAEAFYLTRNKNSGFALGESGHGTGMFTRSKGLPDKWMQWFADNLKGIGTETEISLKTEDGWLLHGRLRIPEGASENKKAPGVVMVHGANHDQDTYYEMTKTLAKHGIATITYTWRGKNEDATFQRGHYGLSMKREDRENGHLDVKAAVNYFAAQKAVDANRIGIIGATLGTQDMFKGIVGDSRIKTVVVMTEEELSDAVKRYVTTMDVPILFIASTEDVNIARGNLSDITKDAYFLSKNKYSQFLLYDDAGRGSEMMKVKPELEGMIVRWFEGKLAK